MRNLTSQPEVFGIKFLTNVCLALQLTYVVPEETQAFFEGKLSFPAEDPTATDIERIDEILCSLPELKEKDLDNFKA